MLIKILANYGMAMVAIAIFAYLFFFHVMPFIVRSYGKAARRGQQYDNQIDRIKKKD